MGQRENISTVTQVHIENLMNSSDLREQPRQHSQRKEKLSTYFTILRCSAMRAVLGSIAFYTDYGRMMAIFKILYGCHHIWDIFGLGLKSNVFIAKTTE